jgi:hypothetical protein
MSKTRKRQPTAKSRRHQSKHPDAALIAACIRYGSTIVGKEVAYEIDPNGDCAHVLALGLPEASLAGLCRPAKTVEGILAKARVVNHCLNCPVVDADPARIEFVELLAEDIARFVGGVGLAERKVPFATRRSAEVPAES